MKYLLLLICVFSGLTSIAQQVIKKVTPDTLSITSAGNTKTPDVYAYVEQMPRPLYDMNEYIAQNLRYPETAKKEAVQGRVMVGFIVNTDSSISDIKVVRGIGEGCDEEAVKLIQKMPKWKPGKQNGKEVRVRYTQPITFRLK